MCGPAGLAQACSGKCCSEKKPGGLPLMSIAHVILCRAMGVLLPRQMHVRVRVLFLDSILTLSMSSSVPIEHFPPDGPVVHGPEPEYNF
jgi:hypothetical protein